MGETELILHKDLQTLACLLGFVIINLKIVGLLLSVEHHDWVTLLIQSIPWLLYHLKHS